MGTEFIAYNAQGQEVRFVSKAAVTVPPASTTRQGAQIITSLGTAEVEVVARAPGSASNVEANTIQLVAIPGLNPFGVQAGSTLEVSHNPLTGGAEATVRIVKDSDVAQVLSAALTGLENQARQMLEQRASQANLKLEATTISPNISDFEQLTGYELSVEPPVGQMVNNANPVFTITVQGHFNAFAAPTSDPLPNQLQRVVSAVLLSEGKLTLDGKRIPAITNWHWDGTRLTVDGTISPNPNYTGQKLSQPTQATIRQQILGKTRAEAQAALDNLVQQGIISGYNLPDRDRLPSWDMQLDLMVEPAPTP